MNLKYKFATGAASAALFASVIAPAAFADTTITVQGNGADSYNKVEVENNNSNAVVQNNETFVVNGIHVSSNTGGNSASKNTGGDVKLKTGDVTSNVTTTVTGSTNTAQVNNCCECDADTDITVKHNGADSYNKVEVKKNNSSFAYQGNKTKAFNFIGVKSKTGKNKANKNTRGNVTLETGEVDTTVETTVEGGENTLNQTGCCDDELLL